MQQYHNLLRRILNEGVDKTDRTGTGTRSIFGHQMRFDLQEGFPLVTTKKIHLKSVIYELLWFLKGDTNVKYLQDNGVRIWDEWARENGDLGPVYGKQWRSWPIYKPSGHFAYYNHEDVDQIKVLIETLKKSPDSRRLIVSAWNVADLPQMALSPCHCLFQFNTRPLTAVERENIYAVRNNYTEQERVEMNPGASDADVHLAMDEAGIPKFYLDCQLYQRSADVFLGVPFNIASYALLTMMIAQVVNMIPGDFVHTFGDVHIYNNHFDQVKLQLSREPRPLPEMHIVRDVKDIDDFRYEDFELSMYNPYPVIKAPVAV